MYKFTRILFTDDVLWGSPRVDGRRLAVGDVVSLASGYGTIEQVLKDFELSKLEVYEALFYCATQTCLIDQPSQFCHNCTHRSRVDGQVNTDGLNEIETEGSPFVTGNNFIFLGTLEELIREENGRDWWKIAENLLIDLRGELRDL